MTELNIEGMTIAPGVVETVVSLAVRDVDGVASVGSDPTSGIRALWGDNRPSTQGIEIEQDENEALHVSVRMNVKSGHVLPDVAARVREAVADAVNMQVGVPVSAVDIFIDGIQFD